MKYKYLIGGITIATDIEYADLIPSIAPVDVKLQYGEVPEHLQENKVDFAVVEANEKQYLLKIPNVGRYLVENGNTITIQAEEGAVENDVKNYPLTAVFGALSYQRDLLPLHGGVFIHNGKGILISGISGSGKSTLLAALHQKGFQIISDDISNIRVVDGKAIVYPSFPRIMAWKDALTKLELEYDENFSLRADMEKYFISTADTFSSEPVVLTDVIILSNLQSLDYSLILKGFDKITVLKNNLFHPWIPIAFNKQAFCYQQILFLSSLVKVKNFYNDKILGTTHLMESFLENLNQNAE